MRKLRICITCIEFPPDTGGVGESVKRIASMLASLGHSVHVVVFHPKHRRETSPDVVGRKGFVTTAQDGVMVHRFQHVVRSEDATVQDYLSDVYVELGRLHAREHFDVFHTFFLNEVSFLATLFAKEVERPVIASVRGADLHRNVFNTKQYSQIAWVLESAHHVTFVSRALERRAQVLVPSIRGRTTAFWNSIEPMDFESLAAPTLPRQGTGPVVAAFGNFRDKKGTDHLIWACAELADELDLTLLLVGDFVPKEKSHWKRLVEESGIGDRLIVTGRLPRGQALAYHHLVDVFVIPSIRDGCPNALLEAMLASKAILATGVDAIGEILSHEEDAVLIETASTEGLVAGIRRLGEDSELRTRLGEAARHKVRTELAPEVELENWLAVYESVAAEGIRARAAGARG